MPMLEDISAIDQETLTVKTIAKQDVDTIASHLAVTIVIMTPLRIFHLIKWFECVLKTNKKNVYQSRIFPLFYNCNIYHGMLA